MENTGKATTVIKGRMVFNKKSGLALTMVNVITTLCWKSS